MTPPFWNPRRFVSGRLTAVVNFNDQTDQYSVRLCPLDKGEGICEKIKVGNPGAGPRSRHGRRIGVDDPRALRDAVHAAISFSSDDMQALAATNRRGFGWQIKPARPRKKTRR